MEVINGGYGIKNPLLSPDIHIQPVSVDETITGNYKNAQRNFRFLCFYYLFFNCQNMLPLSNQDSDEPVLIRAVSPEPSLFTHTVLK